MNQCKLQKSREILGIYYTMYIKKSQHCSISAVQSGSRQGVDPCCVRGASFSGFPPCLVFAGGVEIFRDDVEALYSILKAAAPTAGHELFVHENMVHVSPMLGALGSESARRSSSQPRKKRREVKDRSH